VFLAFQYPVEIPGVNNAYLLKAALNAVRKPRGLPELDAFEFLALVREKMKLMQMDESFLNRGVNEGFSGGEKKRNEILQMACSSRRSRCSTRRTRASTSTRCGRRRRRHQPAPRGSRDRAGHALPAPARLHRAGLRPRAVRRADHQERRPYAALELEKRGYDWVRQEAKVA
jgi:Fe-S cluster assembly ATP-binding protein